MLVSLSELGLDWASCFSRGVSSLRGPLDEYKSEGNETGRMSANKDKNLRKDEWDKKKKNLFQHHASRTGVHLRASYKYVMIESTKPALSHWAK